MNIPRVYADFSSLEYATNDLSNATIGLTGYGTLASLSKQKLQLREGMTLLLYEPNDIEVEGTAFFDWNRVDPAGRRGEWMARINATDIRESTTPVDLQLLGEHVCVGCGQNLASHLKKVGQQYREFCPSCGTSIMAPLQPPRDAV